MVNPHGNAAAARHTAGCLHDIDVLLIETDHAAVVLLNRILTELGCSVTSVQSSSEIQEALDTARFDLILLGASADEDVGVLEVLISRRSAVPLTILSIWPSRQSSASAPGANARQVAVVKALLSRVGALRIASQVPVGRMALGALTVSPDMRLGWPAPAKSTLASPTDD